MTLALIGFGFAVFAVTVVLSSGPPATSQLAALPSFSATSSSFPIENGVPVPAVPPSTDASRQFAQSSAPLVALRPRPPASSSLPQASSPASVPVQQEQVQTVTMRVLGFQYEPATLTVKAGIPVRWVIDASEASGCTSSIVIPSLNISKSLSRGENIIEFTPPSPGRIGFSCGMGMARGSFIVE